MVFLGNVMLNSSSMPKGIQRKDAAISLCKPQRVGVTNTKQYGKRQPKEDNTECSLKYSIICVDKHLLFNILESHRTILSSHN